MSFPTPPPDQDLILPGDPRYGLIWQNPARVSGTPCFCETRVPVESLWVYLAAGHPLETFLDHFDGVTRERAVGVIRLAAQQVIALGKAA